MATCRQLVLTCTEELSAVSKAPAAKVDKQNAMTVSTSVTPERRFGGHDLKPEAQACRFATECGVTFETCDRIVLSEDNAHVK